MRNNIMDYATRLQGKKVLYFEGAGMDFYEEAQKHSDVGNFRIRTSFVNNDGVQFYLEIGNGYKRDKKGKATNEMHLWCDFAFDVNEKDEFGHQVYGTHKPNHLDLREIPYMKEDITKWINENFNTSFDTIHVLDRFYNYYVHGDNGVYNLMESIELNHERASKRSQSYDNAMEYYKNTRQFPCLTILEMQESGLVIKCQASDSELKGLDREKVFTV